MQLYTYCSYRGSYNGYQYAFCDEEENKEWIESFSANEIKKKNLPEEFLEVKRIMERESGWKLILKKYKEKAILLVSKLEEVPSQEGKDNDLKEKEYFFINLAFVAELPKLRKIAMSYVEKLIDLKEKECLNQIKNCLMPSENREKYLLNLTKCREFFSVIESEGIEKREKFLPRSEVTQIKNLFGRKKILGEYSTPRHLKKSLDEKLRDRKEKARSMSRDILWQPETLLEEYILIVTNGGSSLEGKKVNLMFDIDYIR